MVADHGSDERLQPSPGRVEGRHELRELTVLVLDVAEGQHGGEVHLEQCVGRGALSAPPAEAGPAVEVSRDRVTGDVPGRGDDGVETRGLPIERARARGARSDPAQPAAVTAHHVQPPARPRGSERERERVPVGRPRGRARAVIQPREAPPLAPVGTHQVDVMDASTGSRERDEATVGRPRRLAIVAPPAGQPLRAAAAAGDREDVAVAARGTAHEGDPASRGPGRRVLVRRSRTSGAPDRRRPPRCGRRPAPRADHPRRRARRPSVTRTGCVRAADRKSPDAAPSRRHRRPRPDRRSRRRSGARAETRWDRSGDPWCGPGPVGCRRLRGGTDTRSRSRGPRTRSHRCDRRQRRSATCRRAPRRQARARRSGVRRGEQTRTRSRPMNTRSLKELRPVRSSGHPVRVMAIHPGPFSIAPWTP